MFNPQCVELSLGSPLIAVDALAELRDLLTALQVSSGHDKASLKLSFKELARALVELLIEAARDLVESEKDGGGDES